MGKPKKVKPAKIIVLVVIAFGIGWYFAPDKAEFVETIKNQITIWFFS